MFQATTNFWQTKFGFETESGEVDWVWTKRTASFIGKGRDSPRGRHGWTAFNGDAGVLPYRHDEYGCGSRNYRHDGI